MTPRALLDCDGVVANFTHHVGHRAHQLAGLPTPTETPPFKNYKFLPEVAALTGIPEEEVTKAISSPGFCETIPPFPGASAFVDNLSQTHEVIILTSPWYSPTWVSERYAWLANHLNIPRKNVIFAQRKELVQGDILIDDRLIHLTRWVSTQLAANSRKDFAGVLYNPTPAGVPLPTLKGLSLCATYNDILSVARAQAGGRDWNL